jgi:hypothetical protein
MSIGGLPRMAIGEGRRDFPRFPAKNSDPEHASDCHCEHLGNPAADFRERGNLKIADAVTLPAIISFVIARQSSVPFRCQPLSTWLFHRPFPPFGERGLPRM